jgi:hypothetical protein
MVSENGDGSDWRVIAVAVAVVVRGGGLFFCS